MRKTAFDYAEHHVIAGFPGVGKSTLVSQFPNEISDSDSSKFPKDGFPGNYIEHIRKILPNFAFVLVSSHKEVRNALVEADIPFILVYPKLECKEEYLERYKKRGSPAAFVDLLEKNWETWIQECRDQEGCKKIELQPGQFLIDIF